MTRDSLVTPSRAAVLAGTAMAVAAAVPALAATPEDPTTATTGAVPASGAAATIAPAPLAQATTTTPLARTPAKVAKTEIRVRRQRVAGRVGRRAAYSGRVTNAPKRLWVRLETREDGRWKVVARDAVDRKGRFRITKRIDDVGRVPSRLRVVKRAGITGDRRGVKGLHGFRRAYASYYGPGLYGGPLACGGRLSPGTHGVAHKSLPCGTKVTVRVGKRQIRTRVIDRGPYVGRREFDLTAATRNHVGFGDVGTVLVDR
ncbi:MAG: septal ring lytic transglycosylase RlpA family protein [Solirubrobacteraceae bacterium]|nr:septal ring lytic transglycosylase RlpA family protein [Solirubrobacteraceae bacterium]